MGSLININTDGLAKFGEIISYALGGTARGERKMAEAKAYAAELEARTKNKVTIIEAHGQEELANYVAAKESRKLRNTMAVIEKAQSHFTEGEKVSDEPVDEGWKNRFFGIVEEISDEELRDIWGRVLAGEVKKPKSYSLRTLEVLRSITKEEAAIIVKAAPFVIKGDSLYADCPLSIGEKLDLREIGLILDEGLGLQYQWDVESQKDYYTTLTDDWVLRLQNTGNNTIKFHPYVYKLSTAGREILKLVNVSENDRRVLYKLIADAGKKKGISRVSLHKIVDKNGEHTSYEEQGIEI